MSQQQAVSLNPADFIEGGLLDAADVIIESALFTMWNYNGTSVDSPALRVVYVDGEDKKHEQYYSAGKADRYVPSEDGTRLLPTGDTKGLNKGSNAAKFIASLFNAEPKIGELLAAGDITALNGTKAHVQRVAQKDNAGQVIKNDKGQDRAILLVSKIHALPGEKVKAAAKGGAAKASAPAAASKATVSTDAANDDVVAEYLVGILAANGGSIERSKVATAMFTAAADKKELRSKFSTRVFQEDFLKSREEFGYDGKVISMAA